MTFGVTPEGFNRKTFDDIVTSLETKLRAAFGAPRLNCRDPKGVLASVVLPFADEVSQVWEVAEIVYNSKDPARATNQAYSGVAELRGAPRKLATVGTHEGMTFTFDGPVAGTIARGDVRFHPEDDPDNVWINTEDFVIGGAGDFDVPVESEDAGATKTFEALATVVILDGPTELVSISVPTDAVEGTDIETEVAWRARSDNALQAQGTSPVDALEAEIELVPGVVSCRVLETPGYIRCVITDGGGDADDDAIAQAIWDGKAAGAVAIGSSAGFAVDKNGETRTVPFDRAAEVTIHVEVEVMPRRSGETVVWGKLYAAAQGTAGVSDVTTFLVDTVDPPTGSANIAVGTLELAVLVAANIDVTVNA
jgi:hypothetical protein